MRKQGSYLAFLVKQQLYRCWYAKLICILICVFEKYTFGSGTFVSVLPCCGLAQGAWHRRGAN